METTAIRKGDDPTIKEQVMSQVFGEFIGFVKSYGFDKGNEFDTHCVQIFQCSKKILWLDQISKTRQMTVVVNSLDMSIEFGVVEKATKKVLHREKLENLRYNISPDSPLQLIDSHQEKFKTYFLNFKKHFDTLRG